MTIDEKLRLIRGMLESPETADPPEVFRDVITSLDRDSLLESVRRYATPHYYVDLGGFSERARFFRETFGKEIPRSVFFYAMKSNDLPAIVQAAGAAGYHADTAGGLELRLALKLGFGKIIYTSPGKTEADLRFAVRHRGRVIINLDNTDEFELLKRVVRDKRAAVKIRLSIRIDFGGVSGVWSKFGVPLDGLKELIGKIRADGFCLNGLHFHSSWNTGPDAYIANLTRLAEYLRENFAPGELSGIGFIDIGGGFFPEGTAYLNLYSPGGAIDHALAEYGGVKPGDTEFDPYAFRIVPVSPLTEFAQRIGGCVRDKIEPLLPKIEIYLEPGRFLSFHSTTILLKVLSVKPQGAIVDGGVNMTGDYRFSEFSFAPIVNLSRFSVRPNRMTIYGPLCDPCDIWGQTYFGEGIEAGDVLAVLHQGAYTYSCAWHFIQALPRYIAKSGKRFFVAARGETFRDKYGGCRTGR
ncbi:MAG: hypothetical protein A2Y33_16265 [Spirochaetes bacterium GWF1_51_8]|nr:MAG: hypothetical protein A2Y33_16265 [Spirochaetes bacterium GWF1_51_8]